jgi:NADPH-dependent 2,4-dienoyl-CoA reductase/sulfur reductase-like enzyme
VNNIKSPEIAEKLLSEKVSDFVVLGRALLADPEFVNKTYENRRKEIIPCMSCLNCTESEYRGGRVSCSANPLTGVERNYLPLLKNGENKNIVIVGAGPAGLEAAKTLAKRNFNPIIFEKRDVIGGSVYLGSQPPLKEKLSTYLDFYKHELDRLCVDLRLNRVATIDELTSLKPYAVINATGAMPLIPPIPGVEQSHVYTIKVILSGRRKLKNQNIAIIGSGMTGLETAEYLVESGNNITIVEMQDEIGPGAFPLNLYDILKRLKKSNVELLKNKKLKSIAKDKIVVEDMHKHNKEEICIDSVVLSVGIKSNKKLLEEMELIGCPVINIGDSEKPGQIVDAVRAGFNVGYTLK